MSWDPGVAHSKLLSELPIHDCVKAFSEWNMSIVRFRVKACAWFPQGLCMVIRACAWSSGPLHGHQG
jgi:hypothetical protein